MVKPKSTSKSESISKPSIKHQEPLHSSFPLSIPPPSSTTTTLDPVETVSWGPETFTHILPIIDDAGQPIKSKSKSRSTKKSSSKAVVSSSGSKSGAFDNAGFPPGFLDGGHSRRHKPADDGTRDEKDDLEDLELEIEQYTCSGSIQTQTQEVTEENEWSVTKRWTKWIVVRSEVRVPRGVDLEGLEIGKSSSSSSSSSDDDGSGDSSSDESTSDESSEDSDDDDGDEGTSGGDGDIDEKTVRDYMHMSEVLKGRIKITEQGARETVREIGKRTVQLWVERLKELGKW